MVTILVGASGCTLRLAPPVVIRPQFTTMGLTSHFTENPFGVAGMELVVGDTADPNAPLNLLRAGNIGWLRTAIDWSLAAPDSTGYDAAYLQRYDDVASRAAQVGVHLCMDLSYSPDWTHPGYHGRNFAPYPTKYLAWTRFVGDMVRRYSAVGVHCYAIWNEPNLASAFTPVTTTSSDWWTEYETLLMMASGVIRTVDPSARIAAYELAYTPSRKLERELALSLDRVGNAIDIVAIHYTALRPEDIYDAMVTRIPEMNPLIRRRGLELWLTEASMPTSVAQADSAGTGAWVTALMMGFSNRPDSSTWNKTFISETNRIHADPLPALEALRSIATRFAPRRTKQ